MIRSVTVCTFMLFSLNAYSSVFFHALKPFKFKYSERFEALGYISDTAENKFANEIPDENSYRPKSHLEEMIEVFHGETIGADDVYIPESHFSLGYVLRSMRQKILMVVFDHHSQKVRTLAKSENQTAIQSIETDNLEHLDYEIALEKQRIKAEEQLASGQPKEGTYSLQGDKESYCPEYKLEITERRDNEIYMISFKCTKNTLSWFLTCKKGKCRRNGDEERMVTFVSETMIKYQQSDDHTLKTLVLNK